MRFDEVGLFWQDPPRVRGKNVARVMPDIPETNWRKPAEYPDLRGSPYISFDVESYDPHLREHGPGWARGDGHVIGISMSAILRGKPWSRYYPFKHEVCTDQNLPKDDVLSWANEQLVRNQPKIGANLIYDVGWLRQEGVGVGGELHDVQFAEALLSESAHVSLDILGRKYVGEGKDTDQLYQWLAAYYGGGTNSNQRANLYRCPPCLVGPYAETDASLPVSVLKAQWPMLEQLGLQELYRLECDLIPLLVEMRFAGVPVSLDRAEQVRSVLVAEEKELGRQLKCMVGFDVNVNAADSLAKAFVKLGLAFNKTKSGKPSFDKSFLPSVTHPIGKLILEQRKIRQTKRTFIEGAVLEAHVKGIVYPQFHPLRGDDGGARSGRFSSSNPNYQNLPSRDERIGPLVRTLIIPDFRVGHTKWRRKDYSQMEYRLLAHYAIGQRSDDVRRRYQHDPNTDYHRLVQELIVELTGVDLPRKIVKNINFGLCYGMGVEHLAEVIGLALAEAKKVFEAYHKAAPFTKATMQACAREAAETGVITTILGRRSQFELWEAIEYRGRDRLPALPYSMARAKYGDVKRAFTHKALNRRLQGSNADFMKKAMLQCWKDGAFAVCGVPRITVHDELDFSQGDGNDVEKAFAYVAHIMETCIPVRVPIRVDTQTGASWGDCL